MRGNDVDNNTYLHILINTLTKKNNLLDNLIQITLFQTQDIDTPNFNVDEFNKTLSDKDMLIEQLIQLDDGFEKVYDHVKDEISSDKDRYKQEILQLQDLIKQITEKSVKLQTEELRNKVKIDTYFSTQKKEIKNFKISKQTVSNYYKSMPYKHQGQSYFLDKKN